LGKLGSAFVLILALLGLPAYGLKAQEDAPLRFDVLEETGSAVIVVGNLLDDPRLLDAIHSGFPLRIRMLVQLWKDGFFDDVCVRLACDADFGVDDVVTVEEFQ